jgi:virulence factor Mce-like protein
MSPRALVTTLGAVVVVVAVLLLRGGDDGKYTVKAVYADAAGLTKNYHVKVDGVPAGSVKSVDLDKQDHAVIEMELDDGAAPIGAGARALARPVNLLGEKYIDLQLGDQSHPLPSGSTIPISHTGGPVELDDVLNTLDSGTRARLRILINEAGTALAGRGADFNALLRVMPKALDQTQRVVAQANTQNAALRSAIVAGDRIIASVDDKRSDLQRLVTSADDALGTVARRRADLGATLDSSPAALRQLTATLGDLQRTAGALTPASRALRQAAPPLTQVLDELPGFTKDASDTLDKVVDVAPTLASFGRRATPDLRRVTQTVSQLSEFSHNLAPLTRGLERGVLRDAISLMSGWSKVIQRSDGLGHIFRVRASVDPELLTSALTHLAGDSPPIDSTTAAKRKPAAKAEAPAAATPSAPAPSAPATEEKKLSKRLPIPLPSAVGDAVDSIGDGVNSILDQLLGGLKGGTTPKTAPRAQTPKANADNGMQQLLDYLLGS